MILLLALNLFLPTLFHPLDESIFKDSMIIASSMTTVSEDKTSKKVMYPVEKIYLDGGYLEVNEALQEAEEYLKQDIPLPTRLPPVAFTHHFGIFSTLGSPQLEITYLNEDSGHTHYKIYVTPLEHKLEFRKEHVARLKDGSEAIYYPGGNFVLLAFEKKDLQYVLMVDKIHPEITKEVLVKIANSITP